MSMLYGYFVKWWLCYCANFAFSNDSVVVILNLMMAALL